MTAMIIEDEIAFIKILKYHLIQIVAVEVID
ncbi:MAG: hypothetical protein ACI9A7_001122 [Cyclobacteriaceae bacterium]|jgi:hypothetical protein